MNKWYSLVLCVVTGCGGAVDSANGASVAVTTASAPVVSPLAGGLTGRTITATLASSIPDQTVELFQAAPPAGSARWNLIATTRSSGHAATFSVPSAQAIDGDDLYIVVPGAGGASTASLLRLWTRSGSGIRTDRISVSDFGNVLGFTGVLPYFEAVVLVELHSTSRTDASGEPLLLGSQGVQVTRPGQVGNGLGMVDTAIVIPLEMNGQINPLLPKNGEILSVGFTTERPSYVPVACFEFCNDLKGGADCSLHGVPCPDAL